MLRVLERIIRVVALMTRIAMIYRVWLTKIELMKSPDNAGDASMTDSSTSTRGGSLPAT